MVSVSFDQQLGDKWLACIAGNCPACNVNVIIDTFPINDVVEVSGVKVEEKTVGLYGRCRLCGMRYGIGSHEHQVLGSTDRIFALPNESKQIPDPIRAQMALFDGIMQDLSIQKTCGAASSLFIGSLAFIVGTSIIVYQYWTFFPGFSRFALFAGSFAAILCLAIRWVIIRSKQLQSVSTYVLRFSTLSGISIGDLRIAARQNHKHGSKVDGVLAAIERSARSGG